MRKDKKSNKKVIVKRIGLGKLLGKILYDKEYLILPSLMFPVGLKKK